MQVMTLIQVTMSAVHVVAVAVKHNGFTCQLLLAADTQACHGRLYVPWQVGVTPHCTSSA